MRRITTRTGLIIVVGTISALLLLLLDLLKGALASKFPSLPLWIIVTSIVIVIVLATAVGLWYERLKSTREMPAAAARESSQRMLKLLENEWITGFLENPLYYSYDEQRLLLPLRKRVGSHFDLVLSDPLSPTQPISPGTTIMQVFDQAGGELLILGEPGAGKTTLLLELARDLLKRAKDNEAAPIPVVLMLASWASEKLPLEQWIVEELRMKYNIPSQIGEEWVKANQLLLLLDGLDEMTPDALSACIEVINTYYHQAHRSLVVCSQTRGFLDQPGRLALHTAVIVQPLSSEQIGTYLDGLAAKGEEIEGLKRALHQSAKLRALATTPLFLTVLILAYHGKPVQELLALVKAAPEGQQHLLFHNYVEQMLQRKGTHLQAPAQKTRNWLAWLARQLTAHQQRELYLERLQPDWLPKGQRAFYRWSIGLVGGLVVGPIYGLVFGLLNVLLFVLFPWPGATTLVSALVGGLVGGLVVGLVVGLVFGLKRHIQPREVLAWLGVPRYWVIFLPITLLVVGLEGWLGNGPIYGLVFGLYAVLVFILVTRVSINQLDEYLRLKPNEGIWRSVRNGLVGGLVYGLLFGLVGGLLTWSRTGLVGGLVRGLVYAFGTGLVLAPSSGLGAFLQHFTLRFWLWRTHLFPWQAVPFLDDTVEQLLLRKVGGGYIFRHRLLQDYFASLEPTSSPQQ